VNFNDPGANRDCRQQGGGRQGLRGAQSQRRQACAAAAGVGAFPLQPDEACCREAARLTWTDIDICARRRLPLINNIDVAVEIDADRIRDALVPPGLWSGALGGVRAGASRPAVLTTVVECGPGKVLAGMVKRIDAELTGLALFDPGSLAQKCKECIGMSEDEVRRPGGPGYRRLARHRRCHCLGTGAQAA